jgi:hypothetical protein
MSAEEERRNQLYRGVGEALHLAQTLELHISILISILNEKFHTQLDVDGLIQRSEKTTLGHLIRELRTRGVMDNNAESILKEALSARNYITHDFFCKNVYAFSDDDVLRATLDRLDADTMRIGKATAMMMGFVEGFCAALIPTGKKILVEQDI